MKKLLLAFSAMILMGSMSGMASMQQESRKVPFAQGGISMQNAPSGFSDSHFKAMTRADETLELKWGYCGDPSNAFAFPAGELKGAIMMTAAEATELAGATIDAIMVANPTLNQQNYPNPLRNATVWIAESLEGDPLVSADGTLGRTGFNWSTISLDTPYTIEAGKEIYIGYTFQIPSRSGFFGLITDFTYPETEHSAYLYSTLSGFNNQGQMTFGDTYSWKSVGTSVGNLCIRALTHGDMLPVNRVVTPQASVPVAVKPGQPFNTSFYIKNTGANTVNDVDVTMEIKGQEAQTANIKLDKAISNLGTSLINYQFVCENEGCLEFDLYISAVNGTPTEKLNPYSSTVLSLTEGYDRNVVIEEATGTWCGWCVVGYAGMEYMKENYTGKGFLGIAVHQGDDMSSLDQGGAYQNYYNYVSGFPSAFNSRNWTDNIYPNPYNLEESFLDMRSYPAPVAVEAELKDQSALRKTVTLSTKTRFSLDLPNQNYGLAYTVVEDNVGPYPQQNYASGMSQDYFGFENKPKVVNLTFNDVARNCSHPDVIEETLMSSPTTEKEYEYTTQIRLSDVSDLNNYRVIVMVIDTKTGLIQNASQAYNEANGVADVTDSSVSLKASAGKGMIHVESDTAATVYAADGRAVASGVYSDDIEVPAGLYIVNANGKSVKVLVF